MSDTPDVPAGGGPAPAPPGAPAAPAAPPAPGAPGPGAAPDLTPDERRVLGVLLEKSLSTPDYYPLTLSSLTAGCNQRSNRDPVVSLDEEAVREALASLQKRHLVMAVRAETGYATRWRHEIVRALGVQPREQAILAELLLRGPQTVGELRTRASRMRELKDLEEVEEALARLAGAAPSLCVKLPQEAGARAPRHADRLRPPAEADALLAGAPAAAVAAVAPRSSAAAVGRASAEVALLREQVAALERRVARLERELGVGDGSSG
jgi:hypothetical protein